VPAHLIFSSPDIPLPSNSWEYSGLTPVQQVQLRMHQCCIASLLIISMPGSNATGRPTPILSFRHAPFSHSAMYLEHNRHKNAEVGTRARPQFGFETYDVSIYHCQRASNIEEQSLGYCYLEIWFDRAVSKRPVDPTRRAAIFGIASLPIPTCVSKCQLPHTYRVSAFSIQ
jgi:hypothetical protein